MAKYIHENNQWPEFTWAEREIQALLGNVRQAQGRLLGQMDALGFAINEDSALFSMTLEIIRSSEIEGVILNKNQVRSSIARKLGIDGADFIHSDKHVDAAVEIMIGFSVNYHLSCTC